MCPQSEVESTAMAEPALVAPDIQTAIAAVVERAAGELQQIREMLAKIELLLALASSAVEASR
jgi:hypothetical protein